MTVDFWNNDPRPQTLQRKQMQEGPAEEQKMLQQRTMDCRPEFLVRNKLFTPNNPLFE